MIELDLGQSLNPQCLRGSRQSQHLYSLWFSVASDFGVCYLKFGLVTGGPHLSQIRMPTLQGIHILHHIAKCCRYHIILRTCQSCKKSHRCIIWGTGAWNRPWISFQAQKLRACTHRPPHVCLLWTDMLFSILLQPWAKWCKVKCQRYIFYRRLTSTDTYEPFKSLACDWQANHTRVCGLALVATVFDVIHVCNKSAPAGNGPDIVGCCPKSPGQPRTASGVFALFCHAQSTVDNIFLVDFKLYSDLQEFRRGWVISLFHGCCMCVCELTSSLCIFGCATTAGVAPQDALADNNPWDFCGFDGTWGYGQWNSLFQLSMGIPKHAILDVQLRSLTLSGFKSILDTNLWRDVESRAWHVQENWLE